MSFLIRLLVFVSSITAAVAYAADGVNGVAVAMTALGLAASGGMVGGFVGAALYAGTLANHKGLETHHDGEEEATHVVFQSPSLDR